MQRPHSVYVIDCLCGLTFESVSAETQCPGCARLIVLHWRADYAPPPEKAKAASAS